MVTSKIFSWQFKRIAKGYWGECEAENWLTISLLLLRKISGKRSFIDRFGGPENVNVCTNRFVEALGHKRVDQLEWAGSKEEEGNWKRHHYWSFIVADLVGVHLLAYNCVDASVFTAACLEDDPEEQAFHIVEDESAHKSEA